MFGILFSSDLLLLFTLFISLFCYDSMSNLNIKLSKTTQTDGVMAERREVKKAADKFEYQPK